MLPVVKRRDHAVVPRKLALAQRAPDADALADGGRVLVDLVVALDPWVGEHRRQHLLVLAPPAAPLDRELLDPLGQFLLLAEAGGAQGLDLVTYGRRPALSSRV